MSIHKRFLPVFILLCVFTLIGAGCNPSNVETSSAGTGITTSAGITMSASPTSIATNGTSVLTATVRDANGQLVTAGNVTFSFTTASMGTFDLPPSAATASKVATIVNGSALVSFTAKTFTGTVTISAVASGGQTGSITITITAASVASVSLAASTTTVPAGATSTLTALVVDSNGQNVVDGTVVTFSVSDPLKGSLPTAIATTAGGSATMIFTATSPVNTLVVVSASAGGKTSSVTITITGGAAGGTMILSASPTTVDAKIGNTSTITANLKDSSGVAVQGATVTFSLVTAPTSTSALFSSTSGTTASAPTDASGNATVTLNVGTTPTAATVTATTLGITSFTAVNIVAPTGSGSLSIQSVVPSSIVTGGQTASVTVVLKDNTGSNAPDGTIVNFGLSNLYASITPTAATTNGVATATLTSGSLPTSVNVTASGTGLFATLSANTTVSITAPPPATVSLAAMPATASISVKGTAVITATVRDIGGSTVPDGQQVTFTLSSSAYGNLSTTTVFTSNGNGTASTTFTAGTASGSVNVTAVAGSATSSPLTLTITPATTGSIEFVSATPAVIGIAGTGQVTSSSIVFLVKDINGDPASDGTAVSFNLNGPGGGEYIGANDATPTTATGSTVGGNASVILNSGSVAGPVTIVAATNTNSGNKAILAGSHTAVVTTITVDSTTGFPTSGRLLIDSELIDYTGTSGTTFTGCTRGTVGTTPTTHNDLANVFGQVSISSSASLISIGGGVPSATHFNLATSRFNLPGLVTSGVEADITAFVADRFGNWNILDGTAISFRTEAGAIYSSGTAASGKTTVKFRTMVPMPTDVAIWGATDPLDEAADIGLLNAFFGTTIDTGGTDGHPRDGWVTVLATVQGEEAFLDENGDGLFTRSLNNSKCPVGYTCECPGGAPTYVNGNTACTGVNRSEGFLDLGEPFIDKNDDGCRNDGSFKDCNGTLTASTEPVEEFLDTNKSGAYNPPNHVWDGPGCQGTGCEASKTIWTSITLAFTGHFRYCEMTPTTIGAMVFGSSKNFLFMVGDTNTNNLVPGTTITVTTTTPGATLSGQTSYTVPDGVPVGPSVINFTLNAPTCTPVAPAVTCTQQAAAITITASSPSVTGCTLNASGTFN